MVSFYLHVNQNPHYIGGRVQMTLRAYAHDDELLTNGSYTGAELCHVCAVKAAFKIKNYRQEKEREIEKHESSTQHYTHRQQAW